MRLHNVVTVIAVVAPCHGRFFGVDPKNNGNGTVPFFQRVDAPRMEHHAKSSTSLNSTSQLRGMTPASVSQQQQQRVTEEAEYCSAETLRKIPSIEEPRKLVSFIAMGDVPYYESERYCLNEQLRNLRLTPPDEEGPTVMIHVGDIKKGIGGGPCDDEAYNDVAEIFNHTNNKVGYDPRDAFFVVGDNEWIDCEDPDDAWKKWMRHFGPTSPFGFGTLSFDGVKVERQLSRERLPGIHRGENLSFFLNKVLFVGLNLIGGPAVGDEEIRLRQNYDWVRAKIKKHFYEPRSMKALVLFGHAPLDGARKKEFGAPFQRFLAKNYPDLPVLYLHGNGHVFCAKYLTFYGTENLVDVEVEAGDFAPPIEISVLEDPVSGNTTFHIDQRGGLYPKAGACIQILEKTWTEGIPIPGEDPFELDGGGLPPETPPGAEPFELDGGGLPQVMPPVAEADLPPLVFYKNPTPHLPLPICHGHCTKHSECEGQYKCKRRTGLEPVPGCFGEGKRKRNYCYDPRMENVEIIQNTPVPTLASTTSAPTPVSTPAPSTSPSTMPSTVPSSLPTTEPSTMPSTVPTAMPTPLSTALSTTLSTTMSTSLSSNPASPNPTQEISRPYLYYFKNATKESTFIECQGPCTKNKQCEGRLTCFRRTGFEEVPGCRGKGRRKRNYCFDPKLADVAV